MQAELAQASPADFPDAPRFAHRRNTGGLASPDDVALRVLEIVESADLSPGRLYDVEHDPPSRA